MCCVTREPIDAQAIAGEAIAGHRFVASFSAIVRPRGDPPCVAVEFAAYESMAERMLRETAEEAAARWGVRAVIAQRIGLVGVGQTSLVVSVGADDRATAFEACAYCVDRLMGEAPVWRAEVGADGSRVWIDGEHSAPPVR